MFGGPKKYDAFISYRRGGGADQARLVKAGLADRGLKAFLDVDDLEAGQYGPMLLKQIAAAPNFIVILSPNSLDGAGTGSVFRQEVAEAVKTDRKIVPLIMPGFKFPERETLPDEFKALSTHQGVNYSNDFFDATIDKLVQYFRRRERRRLWPAVVLAAVVVAGLAVAAFLWKPNPKGSWAPFPPLPTARASLMAASIGTKLCAVGGADGNGDLPTLEVNNIATDGRWVGMASLPQTDPERSRHDRSLILDTNPPEMNLWHDGRYQGAAVTLGENLYLIGGWRTVPPYPSSQMFIYEHRSDTWRHGEPLPILSACSSAGVIDGKIYVLTACDGTPGIYNFFHVYDPATSRWERRESAPHQHMNGVAGVIGGKLYVAGGIDGSKGFSSALDVYDPASRTWSTKAPMPTERAGFAAGVLKGRLYAVGGFNRQGVLSALEVYDPATDTWVADAPMLTARRDLACAVIDDRLYVVGGADAHSRILSSAEVYTPP